MEIIEREYGNYLTETEDGYSVSLLIDAENIPEAGGEIPSAGFGLFAILIVLNWNCRGENRAYQELLSSEEKCFGCSVRTGFCRSETT